MDKQSSKSGGYVGGFFQLFDWKAKSRKKLFSNKSESQEHAKQEMRSEGNLPMTRLYHMDEYETGMDYASRGNGGFSCSSSLTDDDGLGSRGPSVVARLMGLDSMPTSISAEPYFIPFSDTQSLRDSQSYHRNLDYPCNYLMMCSGNFPSKMEGSLRQTVEEKPQMQRPVSRPIEKFPRIGKIDPDYSTQASVSYKEPRFHSEQRCFSHNGSGCENYRCRTAHHKEENAHARIIFRECQDLGWKVSGGAAISCASQSAGH